MKSVIGWILSTWAIGAVAWGAWGELKEHQECKNLNGPLSCPTQGGTGPLLSGALWPIGLYRLAVAEPRAHQSSPAANPVAMLPQAVIDKVEPGWIAPLSNDVPLVLALLSTTSEDRALDSEAIKRLSSRLREGRAESLSKLESAASTYIALEISLMKDVSRYVEFLSRGTVASLDTSLSSRSLGLEKALDEFPGAAAFMHKVGGRASAKFSVIVAPLVEERAAIEKHPEIIDTVRKGFMQSAQKLIERYKEIFGKTPEKIEIN